LGLKSEFGIGVSVWSLRKSKWNWNWNWNWDEKLANRNIAPQEEEVVLLVVAQTRRMGLAQGKKEGQELE